MDIKKFYGYVISEKDLNSLYKNLDDTYDPPICKSENWKQWVTSISPTTCEFCSNLHGKIYAIDDDNFRKSPIHDNCRCTIVALRAIEAGNATKDRKNGADFWVKYLGRLPDYYISKKEIEQLGWRHGKAPKKYCPGKMIIVGIYRNENKHLPDQLGRTWYEADINYYEGRRNRHRILWSNDGLIFVTYDHYATFCEII